MKICIVGLGLIGGSFSLGLKSKDHHIKTIGVDINVENANKALELGIADEIMDFEEGIKAAKLTVLATPVNIMVDQLIRALDLLPEGSVIIDLGSTKENLCSAVENHPKRGQYVAAHPIAGTENSGPDAAFANLMKNKIMILCDKEKSDPGAFDWVVGICKTLEMRLSYMDAVAHDKHIAYVSHLSHISSFALGSTVLDKEKDEESIFALAGSGFSSTVRLAKSSADMWAPIFTQNKENVLEALDAYIKKLQYFRDVIDAEDEARSKELMTKTNDIRRVLLGIEKNGG
jgi:prephenate dehydrogenase